MNRVSSATKGENTVRSPTATAIVSKDAEALRILDGLTA